MLSSRQQQILQQLIEAASYLPIEVFTDKYQISSRTVRHDLLMIEEWLRQFEISWERSKKEGVRLILKPLQKKRLLEELAKRPEYLNGEQRVHLMCKQLLQQNKTNILAWLDEFKISRNTLFQDIHEVQGWMEQRNLQMKKSRGELSILGNELDKRTAYLELARKDLSEERMLQFLLEPEGRSIDMKGWNQWFPNDDIYFVIDVVRSLETSLHVEFSDGSYSALILHILMAMERLKRQFSVQMDTESLLELQKTKEFRVVKAIAAPRLNAYFHIQVPEEETGYITQHILGAQREHESDEENTNWLKLSRELIYRVEKELGHPLQRTEQVMHGLAVHLKPAVYRAKFNIQTDNPLLRQLEEEQGDLFELVAGVVEEVMKPKGISFSWEEIGYIVLHICAGLRPTVQREKKRIALVCSSGLGTSTLLQRRMETLFPGVQVIGKYSVKELKQAAFQEIDLLLTAIELTVPIPIPVIRVSPLLSAEDQEKIAGFLGLPIISQDIGAETIQTVNRIMRVVDQHADIRDRNKLLEELLMLFEGGSSYEEHVPALTELLPPCSISLAVKPGSWEDAMRKGNGLLRERGLTSMQYEERLIEMVRTQKHHFIISEGVAFPHASTEDGVYQTGLSLIAFQEPLLFGPSGHPVWLMITLAAADKQRHIKALSTLLDLLNDPEFAAKVKTVNQPERLWQWMREKEGLQ